MLISMHLSNLNTLSENCQNNNNNDDINNALKLLSYTSKMWRWIKNVQIAVFDYERQQTFSV